MARKKSNKTAHDRFICNLHRLSENKNLTQVDIARLGSMNQAHVNRVFTGHKMPTLETVQKFANALDCEVAELFY